MDPNIIVCPLIECDWWLDATPPMVPMSALAGVFGAGVMSAVSVHQHAYRIEGELRAHYRTHDAAAFLSTITVLTKQRDRLAETVARVRERLDEYAAMPIPTDGQEAPDYLYRLGRHNGWVDVTAYALAALDVPSGEQTDGEET